MCGRLPKPRTTTPDNGGTRLVFTHVLPAEDDRPKNLAGWHVLLRNLEAHLTGQIIPSMDAWQEFHDFYAARGD